MLTYCTVVEEMTAPQTQPGQPLRTDSLAMQSTLDPGDWVQPRCSHQSPHDSMVRQVEGQQSPLEAGLHDKRHI